MTIPKDLLNLLACPVCKGDLELKVKEGKKGDVESLFCSACDKTYAVEKGIPVLMVEEEKEEEKPVEEAPFEPELDSDTSVNGV